MSDFFALRVKGEVVACPECGKPIKVVEDTHLLPNPLEYHCVDCGNCFAVPQELVSIEESNLAMTAY